MLILALIEMVSSLYLRETENRAKEVSEKYGTTFEWIWTDTDLDFRAWLRDGRGGYWISGKPGSGKSTIMKYIYTKCSNREELPTPSRNRRQISIGFFFHNRGSHLQKSFEGLLHSILHRILVEEPRLAEEIMPIYLQRKEPEKKPWLLLDLMQAFSRILEQDTVQVDIYLFLDALDEFDGPPETIAGFIQSIITRPDRHAAEVKICFSSRPWNTFTDRFSHCSGFKIQEQTRQDIQKYIIGRLAENPSTAILLASNDIQVREAVEKLASDIMERAEGVFLWLKLVMDDLIRAHAEGDSLRELTQHLSAFPKDLEDLYKNIIQRVPQEFRQESYYMLEIVLRSDEQLDIDTFMDCLICAPCKTLKDCVAKLKAEIPTSRTSDSVTRRLKSRCGGLIELIACSESGIAKLQFMHQTVKDFISLPEFQKLITQEDNLIPGENGYTFLSKFLLSTFISCLSEMRPDSTLWLENINHILEEGGHSLYQAEVSTGKSQKLLLNEAESITSSCFERITSSRVELMPFNSFISFCVVSNLYLYIQETLQERHRVNSNPTLSMLLHCIVQLTDPPFSPFNDVGISRQEDFGPMTRLLLAHGADPKALWEGLTPFQIIVQRCFRGLGGSGGGQLMLHMLNVAHALLDAGQDPDEDIVVRGGNKGRMKIKCKALHVVNTEMAQLLLQYNADVNALDEQGSTALDVCVEVARYPFEVGYHRRPEDAIQLTLLLLNNGACLTREGEKALGIFTEILKKSCGTTDLDRIRSAPLLPKRQQVVPAMKRLFQRKDKPFDT